jgi:ribosome-binding protein aMBF1 (putative translation factor)
MIGNKIFNNTGPVLDLELAQRFRQAREFLGISIERLAFFLKTSSDKINKVEQGKLLMPTIWLYRFSKYWGINANWLLSGDQCITNWKTQSYYQFLKPTANSSDGKHGQTQTKKEEKKRRKNTGFHREL